MKPARIIVALIIGVVLGWFAGSFIARERARVAVIAGPDSDNYRQARSELADALEKLRSGNTNVIGHLTAADAQIEKAQQWTRRFLGRE
jgi:hypothetical protein